MNTTDALARLLESYIDFTAEHSDLIGILIADSRHLPEPDRLRVQQSQHDYLGEWQHLLHTVRPQPSPTEARIRIHASVTVANELARIPHLRGRADTIDTAKRAGMALLLSAHPR